jgi:N-acetylglucosamine repressor
MRRNSVQTSDIETNILKSVREANGISRVQVARVLGLAPSTTGVYVERLLAAGFLVETESQVQVTGRPPRLLKMNPDGGEFIGVDFEARNILAVAVDFSDRPLRNAHKVIEESDTVPQIIAKIESVITELLPPGHGRLLAIGVGVPGIVDSSRGVAVQYKYIANWQNVPLGAHLTKRFGVPVFLENNVRSMALAELWFGQGKGIRDFICVGVRSGIGVGIVLNGQIYRGARFGAGELGRWRAAHDPEGEVFWYGTVGDKPTEGLELQDIASARAILNALRTSIQQGKRTVLKDNSKRLTLQDVSLAAQQRDALTLKILAQTAKALGSAIGHLILILNPSRVMLAGPLTLLGATFLDPLKIEIRRRLELSGLNVPEIVNSNMGEFSGALGAAALALHEWKPKPGPLPKPQVARRKRAARS